MSSNAQNRRGQNTNKLHHFIVYHFQFVIIYCFHKHSSVAALLYIVCNFVLNNFSNNCKYNNLCFWWSINTFYKINSFYLSPLNNYTYISVSILSLSIYPPLSLIFLHTNISLFTLSLYLSIYLSIPSLFFLIFSWINVEQFLKWLWKMNWFNQTSWMMAVPSCLGTFQVGTKLRWK